MSGISFRIINCSSFCSFCYCCYCCCCCRRRRSLSVRSIQLLTEEAHPTHSLSSCFPLPSLHSHFAHAAASDGLHKKERHKEKKQAEWEKEEEETVTDKRESGSDGNDHYEDRCSLNSNPEDDDRWRFIGVRRGRV